MLNEKQQKIVEENMNLVYCIVNRYFNNCVDLYDLGMIGLIEAVISFDETKGVALSTYAWKVIYNKILLYLRNDKNPKETVSLDDEWSDVIVAKTYEKEMIENEIIENEEKSILYECLAKLNDKERYVLINYYGLYSQEPRKVKDIAKDLNVTTVRVHFIIRRSKEKLKILMEEKNVRC